ncbi:MAG: nickel transporter, partial [Candidatus Promineifilaceae bacterium]
MKRRRLILLPLAILLLSLARTAAAHPLGNFTINRFSLLQPGPQSLAVSYVVDMAEIPAFQERQRIDADGDGFLALAEQQAYLQEVAPRLAAGLALRVDGAPAALMPISRRLTFPPGQADLPTLRLEIELLAELEAGRPAWEASYEDINYAERLGWREVVVRPAQGVALLASSVPEQGLSDALRAYPAERLQSPPAVSAASFRFAPAGASA